ncbi:hypothetical protein COU78_03420 [Candidatus Peregrinibacteria bacterium CG10_big_fil_rev_8_21_14_0_10_49_24]|nr:MAG: hypothetical protein COV83_05240 [Candidatus Peregrinibacteria bacterium CG11_big_fil_rev_8_21_14_0_20_49_14]PIR51170.1 MAG: hypothetical protein COU78_03420 [Candidatus Peregrinibacteria bacterium CG10_big_fil_rev_8_21_14_0_10_49_24]PJA67209.1 MAG: hypothetical protein CO157_05575 [Candidatus Peregrinibacteria bacterium CG_4_9_14_3_um_filter_49_12]
MSAKKLSNEEQLRNSIDRLEKTISSLPQTYPVLFQPGKRMFAQFMHGIVYGLGMVVAFALVIPFAILLVDQVQWVPLLGDFLTEVVTRMEQVRSLR